jgi:hypothetical protein
MRTEYNFNEEAMKDIPDVAAAFDVAVNPYLLDPEGEDPEEDEGDAEDEDDE